MHIPTHLMSGWCVANLFPLTARERLLCMAAGSVADLDGVTYLFGQEAYWDYHHVVCHNLLFSVLVAGAFAAFSTRRVLAFLVYLAAAHLHLVLDYYGSGPGWPIHYGWPAWGWTWNNPDAWEFTSWQNRAAAGAFLLWTIGIAVVCRRTPVELISPSLDARFTRRPLPGRRGFDVVPADAPAPPPNGPGRLHT